MSKHKRIVTRINDLLVVTDVTQRILPASIEFSDILAAACVEESGLNTDGDVYIECEGFKSHIYFGPRDDIESAKLRAAYRMADMLTDIGMTVIGRPS